MRKRESTLTGYHALTEIPPPIVPTHSASLRRLDRKSKTTRTIVDRYLRMDKGIVGSADAEELADMADRLEQEHVRSSNVLYIQGWMLTEASLAGDEAFSWEDRAGMLERAEHAFGEAVKPSSEAGRYTDRRYRIALTMAHLPLVRAIVNRDVTEKVQDIVTEDVLEIANTIACRRFHLSGLAHEMSVFGLMHMMKDPRYVAIPSTYRGDNGIHHKEQAHDLSLIKQHFGAIRQIQPVEIKSRVSDEHRKRYWSTLLSTSAVIVSPNDDPITFNRSMLDMLNGRASNRQITDVALARDSLALSLKKYRNTGRPVGGVAHTLTRFYGRNQSLA